MRTFNPYSPSNQQPAPVSNIFNAYILDTKNIQVLEVIRKRSITDLKDYYWNFIYSKELSSDDVQLVLSSDIN